MALIFAYIGIGVLVGIFSGVFGVGGGIILVPLLTLGLGYAFTTAAGISLTALLLPVGALGVWEYWRSGRITSEQIRVGLVIALGLFFGTFIGSKVVGYFPQELLRKGFAVVLLGLAIKLWLV